MAEIIRMPEVLAGATEATLQAWQVAAGEAVSVGQPLAEIETDKALVELNAEADGVVGRLLVADGDSVAVGVPILALLAEGEGEVELWAALNAAGPGADADDVGPQGEAASETDTPGPDEARPAPEPEPAVARTSGQGRLFASPLVRRLAAAAGVALGDVPGTGPRGRIVKRDLQRYLARRGESSGALPVTEAPAPSPTTFEDVPVDRMRRAIARRLTESKRTVPHFQVGAECRVEALLALRAEVNQAAPRKISVNDFVVKAVAGALVEVPQANAIWLGEAIRRFHSVDVAVAVAVDGGLMTPVLRGVESMTLTQVSAQTADLVTRAREQRLLQHELEGGSFSVSNLGMYGTTEFSAIINLPQSGILAVGAARTVPVVDAAGGLAVGSTMKVTLSADHRVLDGAVAAQWLAAFVRRIENPLSILI
ncbi:MAG: 2-oxo acid dehydrogenase subunit E2 [Propioniciclava sp.]